MSDAVRESKLNSSITFSKVTASGDSGAVYWGGFRPRLDYFIQAFL